MYLKKSFTLKEETGTGDIIQFLLKTVSIFKCLLNYESF